MTEFGRGVEQLPLLRRGRTLPKSGAPVADAYVLRKGVLKRVFSGALGTACVGPIVLPGTVLGPVGSATLTCFQTHEALTECQVCRIPESLLVPPMRRRSAKLASRALRDEYRFQLTMAWHKPSRRLALTLLRVARAMQGWRFVLPLDSVDVAHYLGMGPEDCRRIMLAMQACGWIHFHGGVVEIRDARALRRYARG